MPSSGQADALLCGLSPQAAVRSVRPRASTNAPGRLRALAVGRRSTATGLRDSPRPHRSRAASKTALHLSSRATRTDAARRTCWPLEREQSTRAAGIAARGSRSARSPTGALRRRRPRRRRAPGAAAPPYWGLRGAGGPQPSPKTTGFRPQARPARGDLWFHAQ